MSRARRILAAFGLSVWIVSAIAAPAAGADPRAVPRLELWENRTLGADWLSLEMAQRLFPEADDLLALAGEAPSATVLRGDVKLGYLFATADVTRSLGFSLEPFSIAVGLALDGTLAGVEVIEHNEPIIDLFMLQRLVAPFIAQYPGVDVRLPLRVRLTTVEEPGTIDGISSATISAVLFNEAILSGARKVARERGLRLNDEPAVDLVLYEEKRLPDLIADGSVGRLRVVSSELAATAALATPDQLLGGKAEFEPGLIIDLLVAPAHPPTIGRNLLGQARYNLFVSGRDHHDLSLLLMANGPYLFDPDELKAVGVLDRLRVVQDGRVFPLDRAHHRYINFLPDRSVPRFTQIGLFWIKAEQGIDPLAPFRVELDVVDREGDGRTTFVLDYALDWRYVIEPSGEALASDQSGPAWLAVWRAQAGNIAILAVLLGVLTAILVKMQWLARRPRLLVPLRMVFLAVVVGWLGWQVGAQVTIVNLLTWLQAALGNGSLAVMLSDPLIAVLMAFVVVSFVVWGRGVFCGWLCPFGALQELLAKAGQRLGIAPVLLSWRAHRLLWPVKYVVLAVLVGLSFYSMAVAGTAAEVEPFKTAISLKFARDWPYVVYAVTLLTIGLFTERFFCRFLCPLGAAMVLGGKLRLRRLNILRRHDECGSPCQLCARRCPIQAIAPSGQIVMDECFYCLDCQVLYHDAHQCPPLAQARKRRQREPEAVAAE